MTPAQVFFLLEGRSRWISTLSGPLSARPTIPSLSRIDSRAISGSKASTKPYLLPLLSCETGDLTRLRPCRMPLDVSFQEDIRRFAACAQARPDAPGENPLLAAILSALLSHARRGLKGALATCTTDPLRLDRFDGPVKQASLTVQSEDLGVIFRLEGFA